MNYKNLFKFFLLSVSATNQWINRSRCYISLHLDSEQVVFSKSFFIYIQQRLWFMKKKLLETGGGAIHHGRRRRKSDLFESLPDEIVISILCKLSSTASSPSDFVTVLLTYVLISSYEHENFFSVFLCYCFISIVVNCGKPNLLYSVLFFHFMFIDVRDWTN